MKNIIENLPNDVKFLIFDKLSFENLVKLLLLNKAILKSVQDYSNRLKQIYPTDRRRVIAGCFIAIDPYSLIYKSCELLAFYYEEINELIEKNKNININQLVKEKIGIEEKLLTAYRILRPGCKIHHNKILSLNSEIKENKRNDRSKIVKCESCLKFGTLVKSINNNTQLLYELLSDNKNYTEIYLDRYYVTAVPEYRLFYDISHITAMKKSVEFENVDLFRLTLRFYGENDIDEDF